MISMIIIADTAPKNHYKENFKRIMKIQAQSKEKQMEAQKPVTVLRKSIKYDSVPPKITVFAQVGHAFLYYPLCSNFRFCTCILQSSCRSATPSVPGGLLSKSKAKQTLHHKQPCDIHDTEKSKKVNTVLSYILYLKSIVLSLQNFLSMNIECAARAKVKRPPSQQRQAAASAKREKEFSNYKRGMIPQ